MKKIIRKSAAVVASLGAATVLTVGATTPAQAIHAGQTFCSSSNSASNIYLEMTHLDTANGKYPSSYRIYPGKCVDVASRDVDTLRIETHYAYCMRVGYDKNPYRAWQYDADGTRNFRPSDNDLIYFDVRYSTVCD
jgi:hypothetical protein